MVSRLTIYKTKDFSGSTEAPCRSGTTPNSYVRLYTKRSRYQIGKAQFGSSLTRDTCIHSRASGDIGLLNPFWAAWRASAHAAACAGIGPAASGRSVPVRPWGANGRAEAETPGKKTRRHGGSDGRRPRSGARPRSRADDPRGPVPGAPSPRPGAGRGWRGPYATGPAAPLTAKECRAPHVCVVIGGGTARVRRVRRPLVGPPRLGWLVPADHRIARSTGLAIEIPHRFPRDHAVRLQYRRITALHPTPGRQFVFSPQRTVS